MLRVVLAHWIGLLAQKNPQSTEFPVSLHVNKPNPKDFQHWVGAWFGYVHSRKIKFYFNMVMVINF